MRRLLAPERKNAAIVRMFHIRDLRHILRIERESFGVDAWPRDAFLYHASAGPGLFLVAKSAQGIVGYSITYMAGNRAELVSITVSHKYRRQGVARGLLTTTLRKVKRLGATVVWLMVRSDNVDAIQLYRGFGFVRRRTVRHYYEDGSNGWLMQMPIE
jgi:[ribosomal protein S18]-alanine N-acetyltransferase